jgi:hypothetical protein
MLPNKLNASRTHSRLAQDSVIDKSIYNLPINKILIQILPPPVLNIRKRRKKNRFIDLIQYIFHLMNLK